MKFVREIKEACIKFITWTAQCIITCSVYLITVDNSSEILLMVYKVEVFTTNYNLIFIRNYIIKYLNN